MPLSAPFQSALPAMATSASSSGTDKKAVIVVYLGGGMDSHNFLTPRTGANRATYDAARPDIGIPDNPATALNAAFQLHPALTMIKSLFDLGKVAIVQNCGPLQYPTTKAQITANSVALPPGLESHSDQASLWQLGESESTSLRTGWAGRMMDLLAPSFNTTAVTPPAFSFNGPQALSNADVQRAIGLSALGLSKTNYGGTTKPLISDRLNTFFLNGTDANLQRQAFISAQRSSLQSSDLITSTIAAQTVNTVFPPGPLAISLRTAIKLIKGMTSLTHRRQVHYVSQGGYDHHKDVVPSLQANLAVLGPALRAAYDATVELGIQNNVTFIVYSEFGRTLQQNISGTDHGWAGHAMVFGGAVVGGIYGTYPILDTSGAASTGARGIYIPTTPFECVYSPVIKWMGVPDTLQNGVNPLDLVLMNLTRFPNAGASARNLGFLT